MALASLSSSARVTCLDLLRNRGVGWGVIFSLPLNLQSNPRGVGDGGGGEDGTGRERKTHLPLSSWSQFPAEGTAGESWWLSWTAEIKALSAPGQALRVGGRAAAQGPLLHLSNWHLGSRGMNDAPLGGGVGVPSAPCRAWGRGQEGGPGPQDGSVLPGGGHPPPPPPGCRGCSQGHRGRPRPPPLGAAAWGGGGARRSQRSARPSWTPGQPGSPGPAPGRSSAGRQRTDSEGARPLVTWQVKRGGDGGHMEKII